MNLFLDYQKKIFNSLKNLEKKKLIHIPNQLKNFTVEVKEILLKVVAWSKCLNVGLMSQQVADMITNQLKEESEKRIDYIKNSLTNNINEGESAVIFTGNQDIPIPENIEKFIISPPELDMVAQWIKNAQQEMEEKIRNQYNTQQEKEKKDGSDKTDSGLWTPN